VTRRTLEPRRHTAPDTLASPLAQNEHGRTPGVCLLFASENDGNDGTGVRFGSTGPDSSDSSGGDDSDEKSEEPETKQDAQAYGEDVSQLAYTYAKQGGDIGSLRTGVSGLAMKRGITNWEVDSLTCQSIGRGVGQAGMSEKDFTDFSKQLFGDDLTKATTLRAGYQENRPAVGAQASGGGSDAAGDEPDASSEAQPPTGG